MPSFILVSHHPPISAYFYISPANQIRIIGDIRPKSRFLGNSVMTYMEGDNRILFLDRQDDGGACAFSVNFDAKQGADKKVL